MPALIAINTTATFSMAIGRMDQVFSRWPLASIRISMWPMPPFSVVRGGVQYCIHASRELNMKRMDVSCCPLTVEREDFEIAQCNPAR